MSIKGQARWQLFPSLTVIKKWIKGISSIKLRSLGKLPPFLKHTRILCFEYLMCFNSLAINASIRVIL
jgi:hypothetical protein